MKIRRIRTSRFQDAIKIGILLLNYFICVEPEKKGSEEKKIPEPVKQVPTIKFTDEMHEQRYIHELCTYILDIGLKAPYVYHFIYS